MVEAARKRGYKYVAITDHSKSLGVAGGLSDQDLMKHTEECRALDAKYSDIRVLAGTEVDIRADGTLDYSDELLAKLDFVVASVHSGFKQDKATLTMRVVRAMQNPHVRVIGHPTGRLLGDRDPRPHGPGGSPHASDQGRPHRPQVLRLRLLRTWLVLFRDHLPARRAMHLAHPSAKGKLPD